MIGGLTGRPVWNSTGPGTPIPIPRTPAAALAVAASSSSKRSPEVPRQLVVPAAVVTQDNVDEYEQYAFN
jgi:hypothetical protein